MFFLNFNIIHCDYNINLKAQNNFNIVRPFNGDRYLITFWQGRSWDFLFDYNHHIAFQAEKFET